MKTAVLVAIVAVGGVLTGLAIHRHEVQRDRRIVILGTREVSVYAPAGWKAEYIFIDGVSKTVKGWDPTAHETIEDQQIEIMRLRSDLEAAQGKAQDAAATADQLRDVSTAADELRDEIRACRESAIEMQNYIRAHQADPALQQIAVALIKAMVR